MVLHRAWQHSFRCDDSCAGICGWVCFGFLGVRSGRERGAWMV